MASVNKITISHICPDTASLTIRVCNSYTSASPHTCRRIVGVFAVPSNPSVPDFNFLDNGGFSALIW
jgi:hypothetical protein